MIYVRRIPRRPPIDPLGIYHVGSRGVYGRTLWEDVGQHEVFLWMYARVTRKYAIETWEWALVENHHHFIVRLTDGGLSEAMRELHGGYSRWFHELHGETRKGHLFRHAFFARLLETDTDVLGAAAYVSANPLRHREEALPVAGDWGGLRAVLGKEHPRRFHSAGALLELLDSSPERARTMYQELVAESHARARLAPSPNDVLERG